MKVNLKEFPYQPKQLPCCTECAKKPKKDCEPNPMNCKDFYIFNMDFINSKLATE
jgi:hypothetical protein